MTFQQVADGRRRIGFDRGGIRRCRRWRRTPPAPQTRPRWCAPRVRRPSRSWPGPPSPPSCRPILAPNKLIYRLADVLAAHKGKPSWTQAVFASRDFIGEWISMAPGEKTKTQFYADDRVFWVVQSGQMKVTIEGQEPFIATKHFLVQVPKRLQYSMETVGNEPVLRFQMRPAGESPDYPLTRNADAGERRAIYPGRPIPAMATTTRSTSPTSISKSRSCRAARRRGVWIRDDHTYVTILRSQKGVPTPPDNEWGHFHANFPEIWLIIEGTQQFLVEGEKLVTVHDGDMVEAPTGPLSPRHALWRRAVHAPCLYSPPRQSALVPAGAGGWRRQLTKSRWTP